jgi:RHS repeat-associated protein
MGWAALARGLGRTVLLAMLMPVLWAQAQTNVTLTSSVNPSNVGQTVTFTATVTGNNPTGQVSFRNNNNSIATRTLSGGVATYSTSNLGAGTHAISARYLGDANNTAFTTDAVYQQVNGALTTTTLTSSPNPSAYQQSVTLKAVVSGGSSPSGSVTFKDGATVLGSATLSGNTATFVTSQLPAGSRSLTAQYAGNSANNGSTSAAITHTVTPPATVTSISGSGSSVYGSDVTFTATVVKASGGTTGLTGSVTFMDGATALGTVSFSSPNNTPSLTTAAVGGGSRSITAVYSGNANNAGSTSAPMTQTVNRAVSSTNIGASPASVSYGQGVTLTATSWGTMTGNYALAPTGTVTFKKGTTVLGTANMVAGQASLVLTDLAIGSHSVSAEYAGDTNYNGSTSKSTVSVTVSKASTTLALSSSASPASYGTALVLTATLGGGASPTGSVTFKNGAATLGTANVSGNTATLTVSSLVTGAHNLSASYAGDANHNASNSAVFTQSITKANTTVTLVTNPNPSTYGQSVTLNVGVVGQTPTGAITFRDGSTTLGTRTLQPGVSFANFPITTLAPGNHNLTAIYSGDANNINNTSAVKVQTVNPAATTTTLVTSTNPASTGQTVTLTASVSGFDPTGNITFQDGANTLGTASLGGTGNTRTATLAVSGLSAGSHALTAVYAGDGVNPGSTSAVLNQLVLTTTSTALSSSVNPVPFGQTVTFTASVTGSTPGGTVTFKDGAALLGTVPLNAGAASWSTASLAVGSHGITAAYSGDASNGTSTAALSQTVSVASTTTTLASSLNPSAYGQTVTFTASVGSASATGNVTFKNGATVLGTVPLASGTASWSTAALKAGGHGITVAYGGDANNAASTSAALTQTVAVLTTSTTLAASASSTVAGQTVTFTATVTGSNPGGVVTFKEGATVLGTATLGTGGTASLSTTRLVAGSRSITAQYGGDPNHSASTSAAHLQTVGLSSGGATLTATPNPATLGQNVTLLVQINGYSPTGTVTFTSGGATLGTVAVAGGAATLSLSSLPQGSHSLGASYSGDANNQPGNANAATLTVNARSGYVWQYGYDAMGRPNTVVDPRGQATYTYYDSLGRAIQTQQPSNTGASTPTVTQYGWNLMDSLTSVADPRNLTTSYSPDGLGNVKAETSPDRGATAYTYDAKGNLLTSTDARGKTTTYGYDTLDRLTSIGYPTGAGIAFEYDGGPSGPASEKGKLTKITDESGQTTYTHDAIGRLTAKSVTIGSRTFTVGYNWGDAGSALDKLTGIAYPGGSRVNYGYDAKGWVNSISINAVNASGSGVSGTSQALLGSVTYNVEGNPTGWQWSDGKARPIAYDSVGLVQSYTLGDPAGAGSAAGVLRTVTRDAAGRITGYTHTNNGTAQPSLDQSFGYDNLNRLLTATVAGTSMSYSYDENGNRTGKTIGGASYANTISATSNRLTQTQDLNGNATVVHDAAGRITSDGANTYSYSDRGRMSSATVAVGTVSYAYNGLEQRARKMGPNGTSYYVYDEQGQLLGEYDGAGKPLYETIYLNTTPVGVMKQTGSAATNDIATTLYNVYADHIDTPRIVTTQDHTSVWRWDAAEAFGATVPNENPSGLGTFSYNQRFPGQIFDSETGLAQNWHREYNARVGRYIQSDPIGLEGGINTFGYVEGNPLSLVDREGLAPTKGLIWLVKICKTGIKKVRPVSPEEAVKLAKQGKDLESNRSTIKKIANAASEGKKPIKDPVHPDRTTGSTEGRKPHYHPNPRNGSHLFYSMATALTVAGQVDCDDCTLGYIAEGLDFFNPLSLPKDLMDLTGIGAPN